MSEQLFVIARDARSESALVLDHLEFARSEYGIAVDDLAAVHCRVNGKVKVTTTSDVGLAPSHWSGAVGAWLAELADKGHRPRDGGGDRGPARGDLRTMRPRLAAAQPRRDQRPGGPNTLRETLRGEAGPVEIATIKKLFAALTSRSFAAQASRQSAPAEERAALERDRLLARASVDLVSADRDRAR